MYSRRHALKQAAALAGASLLPSLLPSLARATNAHPIAGVATAVAAFLGRAISGPVNMPVTIKSFSDFQSQFGGLGIAFPMSYAVQQFFANGGTQAVIVRLYKAPSGNGGQAGRFTVERPAGLAAPVARLSIDGLTLVAVNPGTSGQALTATIEPAAPGSWAQATTPDVTFSLTLTCGAHNETYPALTVAEGPHRIDRVLAAQSALVRWDGDWPVAPPAMPALNATATGGNDSLPLDTNTYLGAAGQNTGLFALDKAGPVNLLCLPPDTRGGDTDPLVYQAALAWCRNRRTFLIVDPAAAWSARAATAAAAVQNGLGALGLTGTGAEWAALYFPRVIANDGLTGQPDRFVPCGAVAGVIARSDAARGVWTAPAGTAATLAGVDGLTVNLGNSDADTLDALGVDSLRAIGTTGVAIWGSRTLAGANPTDTYAYVPVRRLALFIEESIYRGTEWAITQPNGEALWSQVRLATAVFMQGLYQQGIFPAATVQDAFSIKCDAQTTSQSDIDNGVFNIVIGFAPLKAAEFVIIQISQFAAVPA